ncbi:MAG: outer membrane protein assembly factor BamE [Proteobacteria bacterium]|nr:outer membrane protein assembly factor BamE [Pseudomonadota bacterium]
MKLITTFTMIALFTLSACYKIPVQQGNILSQEDIDEVRPGMSKQQVSIILGTPSIAHPFNHDRWDYINTNKVKGKFEKVKKLSLYFEDDKLIRTEGNYFPKDETDI